jgi:hypothetical protein
VTVIEAAPGNPTIPPNCDFTKQWLIIGEGVVGGLTVAGGAIATPFTFGAGVVPIGTGVLMIGHSAYEMGQCG